MSQEAEDDDGDRRTPPESFAAMQAAIMRTEEHAKRGADYAAQVWEEVRKSNARSERVEDRLDYIERVGYRYPLAAAMFAIALSALALACAALPRLH